MLLSADKEENPLVHGQHRTRAAVMLTEGGISHFLNRLRLYLTENTKRNKVLTDKPKANELIANIEDIKRATLKAFWKDGPEFPFLLPDDVLWWEVWFRQTLDADSIARALTNLDLIGVIIRPIRAEISGTQVIRLVKGSANQLSQSLLVLDSLTELRKPQETAYFILRSDITLTERKLLHHTNAARTDHVADMKYHRWHGVQE